MKFVCACGTNWCDDDVWLMNFCFNSQTALLLTGTTMTVTIAIRIATTLITATIGPMMKLTGTATTITTTNNAAARHCSEYEWLIYRI